MKGLLCTLILFNLLIYNAEAQSKSYGTQYYKLIFSMADLQRDGETVKSPVRFSAFVNVGNDYNYNFNKWLGFSAGLEIKNIGFIVKDSVKSKHRAYAIGIPVMLKIGDMDKRNYFFLGAQYDYNFAYKEKIYVEGQKYKLKDPYQRGVQQFLPSAFVGFQTKSGLFMSAHYYFQDFYESGYQFKNPATKYVYSEYDKSRLYFLSVGFRVFLDEEDIKRDRRVLQTRL